MAYYNPNRVKYAFAGTWTSSAASLVVKGPKGKRGTLIDYGFEGVTTAHAGDTNAPEIAVGITGTVEKFGKYFAPGAIAVTTAKSVRTENTDDAIYTTSIIQDRFIPADTDLLMTVKEASGGSAAGASTAFMIVDWAD